MKEWLEKLNDPDPEVRQAYAAALGTPGNHSAVSALVEVLERDENQFVRGAAAVALKHIGVTQLSSIWERALQHDPHWYVRQVAIEMLDIANELPIRRAVVYALVDEDSSVRETALHMLERHDWRPYAPEEQICYWLAKGHTFRIITQGTQILPYVLQLQSLNHSLSVTIGELLPLLYAAIEVVSFGSSPQIHPPSPTTWHNPDVEELTMPLSNLRHLHIEPVPSAFVLIERFLTYALNYLGQTYLRQHVDVHIHGDVAQLHPNLRNNLTSFCQAVHVQT